MEIEVGEYCRSKYGEIGVITNTFPRLMWRKKKNPSLLDFNDIKSHSKNIIDLIEIGDYVNGYKVIDICESQYGGEKIIYISGFGIPKKIYDNQIKSILTKELFNQNSYKIGE